MRGVLAVLVSLAGLASFVLAATNVQFSSHPSPRTLVVIDDNSIKSTHSLFFKSFLDRGHKLSFVNLKQEQLVLTAGGDWVTDNVIFFAPSQEDYGGRTRTSEIIEFIKQGGSFLMASSPDLSETQRYIAGYFGVDYDENRAMVVDPAFEKSVSETDREIAATLSPQFTLLPFFAGSVPQHSSLITGSSSAPIPLSRGVLYSGLGLSIPPTSRFLKTVLSAPATAIAPGSQAFLSYGSSISLVVAMQSLTAARAIFSGSINLFSDAYAAINPLNKHFAASVGAWVVHDTGFLRHTPFFHHKVDADYVHSFDSSNTTPISTSTSDSVTTPISSVMSLFTSPKSPESTVMATYSVKDYIHAAIMLEEYDGTTQKWRPATSAQNKVLFELEMLDPYVRRAMRHAPPSQLFGSGNGVYEVAFQAPDVFGIYTLRTSVSQFEDQGEGLSLLKAEETIAVRPPRHNEYERFLVDALPYYSSVFLTMGAFLVFSGLFLYSN